MTKSSSRTTTSAEAAPESGRGASPELRRRDASIVPATHLRHRHLLGIADLSPEEILLILDTAEAMKEIAARTHPDQG